SYVTNPSCLISFCFLLPPPPRSTLFPYTTLFRSDLLERLIPLPDAFLNVGAVVDRHRVLHVPDDLLPRRRELGAVIGFLESPAIDRKSTRLNSSHQIISYAVFCLKKKKKNKSEHT